MSVKLFVGGLSFSTSSEGLRGAFARFGEVMSAAVMTDRETGRSRGFGFVEMATTEEAEKAISSLNGTSLDGRMIRVDKATPRGAGGPRPPRPAGGPRPYGDRPAGGGFGGPRFGGGGGGGGPRFGAGGGQRQVERSGGAQVPAASATSRPAARARAPTSAVPSAASTAAAAAAAPAPTANTAGGAEANSRSATGFPGRSERMGVKGALRGPLSYQGSPLSPRAAMRVRISITSG